MKTNHAMLAPGLAAGLGHSNSLRAGALGRLERCGVFWVVAAYWGHRGLGRAPVSAEEEIA